MPPSPDDLLLQLFHLQEADRHRVGRALHNQVGQALSAIRMGAHLVQSEDDAEIRQEDLREIIRASDEAVALVRDLHATLHPPQLDSIGLDAALRAEYERLFPGSTVTLASLPHAPGADRALVAFRIVQTIAREVAHAGGRIILALDGDPDPRGGFTVDMQVQADVDAQPLLQALANAAGGELVVVTDAPWRLRLPYGPLPATYADPA